MTREATAGFLAELTADVNRPILLFEATFGSVTLRYNTLGNDITWNGETWTGDGTFKNLPSVTENRHVSASGITVVLTGEPSVLISTMLNESSHNEVGKLYFGFLDANRNVINSPRLFFEGKLNTAELVDSVQEASISLNYETDLMQVLNTNELRYNQKTQQLFYPNDTGFKYMEALANWSGYWGKKKKKNKKKRREKQK